jgi:hypothetical protein
MGCRDVFGLHYLPAHLAKIDPTDYAFLRGFVVVTHPTEDSV